MYCKLSRISPDEIASLEGADELPASLWEGAPGRQLDLGKNWDPAEFRVMFGESGTTAQDPRLRLPTIPRTAYEQLEDLVGAWNRRGKHGLDVTLCARALWSGVHGVARLLLDGALVLDEAEADALVETLIESLLRGLPKPDAAPKRRSR